MENTKSIRVNIGCGRSPAKGWLNFDNSPSIKLAKSPLKFHALRLLGLLNKSQIENINWNKKNKIEFADAAKRIPLSDACVETLYSSHMFEHLSRHDAVFFLKETYRVLEAGGVLRISVPDLKKAALNYLQNEDANDFMHTLLVEAPKIDKFKQKVSLFFSGYRHHQWMYDDKSLSELFTEAGFDNVKVCCDGETTMQNSEGLDLFERSEQSIFLEGTKCVK